VNADGHRAAARSEAIAAAAQHLAASLAALSGAITSRGFQAAAQECAGARPDVQAAEVEGRLRKLAARERAPAA
jgi:hypothetical protein